MLANRTENGSAALQYLFANARTRPKNEPGMSKGVIANHVPLFRNFGHDIRALTRIASNQEECGKNVLLGKNI